MTRFPTLPSSCPAASLIEAVGKAHRRRKADRPQELLEAALTLFVEKGLAATRMEEVAQLAGVCKGTLYLYYPSKDALFKAVVRANLTEVIAQGSGIVDQFDGSTADLLQVLAKTWWSRVGSSKAAGIVLLIINEANKFPELAQFYMDEVMMPTHALLARAVQRGISRGEFRPMDITSVVHALIAPVQFMLSYQRCTAACTAALIPLDADRFITTQIELLLRGLQVRA